MDSSEKYVTSVDSWSLVESEAVSKKNNSNSYMNESGCHARCNISLSSTSFSDSSDESSESE